MYAADSINAKPWPAALCGAAVSVVLFCAGTAAGGDGDALVIVNGKPIARQQVVEMLMQTHGLQVMQQLIALELAQQETRRRGLEVTAADVQEQTRRAVEEIAPSHDAAGVALGDAEKRQALELVLRQKGLTMPEFTVAMERNAHLRKAVEQEFRVDEPTLREEFARTYGEKVEVRHIQVHANDTRALQEALDLLARGADFSEVARRISVNPETAARGGGLMEPFTFTDQTLPAVLREVAFRLAPGAVSTPTQVESMIHILKLERRIPPTEARFEDVRAKVEARLRERVLRQRMNELMLKIFEEAKIRVLDPNLKREFEELRKQSAGRQDAVP
jgi:parvulin-like peptidyl-prolyl isomerase